MTQEAAVIGNLRVNVDMSGIDEAKAKLEELAGMATALHEQIGAAVDIKRLVFNPGDTIVVRVDRPVTAEMIAGISAHVRKSMQVDDLKVLVLDAGITLDVLTSEAA